MPLLSKPTAGATAATEGAKLSPVDPPAARVERKDWSDLGPRIASGLILAIAAVVAAYFGGPWLAGACGAAVVAMTYEWIRMSEPNDKGAAFVLLFIGSLGAVMFSSWGHLDYAAIWLVVFALTSAARRRNLTNIIETAGGALYIGFPPSIFLWLRHLVPEGLETILTLFAIIWASDIFAYFGGKLIGGPKIARDLSPNKTWSGIITGTLAGACAGYGCGTLFHAPRHLLVAWAAIGAIVAFTGLMGDLFESFLKRRFGVKDASRLIPGHGGVLDRIDSLMAATLLVGAIVAIEPRAVALLFGAMS